MVETAVFAPSLIISAAEPLSFRRNRPRSSALVRFAFLGRSNVGKSSLLNRLVRKPGLAFTSSKPGCTQFINFYQIEQDLRFVDLPGYGYAKVPLDKKDEWKKLIEAYLLEPKQLGPLFHIDRRPPRVYGKGPGTQSLAGVP